MKYVLLKINPFFTKVIYPNYYKTQMNLYFFVNTIQHDAIGGVLDCFYTSEEAWIFNPTFLESLD